MKKLFAIIAFLTLGGLHAQEFAAINSAAHTSNNLVYSAGEIYVVYNDQQSSAGLLGAVSSLQFFTLGSQELLVAADITYYPNPVSSVLNIDFKQPVSTVIVHDITGRECLSAKPVNNRINLSELPAGVYIVTTDNPNTRSFKIIKQ